MPLGPGVRLGPYEIVAAIGAGGMGEVYRAHDVKLNRDVALKILPADFALDAERLARFKREAQLLASLNHPNIAAIYGFEDSGETHALVLELVEGETLADRIARGPIALDEAPPIARQICEALEAAHEHGIIHRDLKPANIKVRSDGTVKVLDFGLAKALAPEFVGAMAGDLSQSPTITSPAMTRMGVVLGTAPYMSPEQARGKEVDKRADVWAFGCVLYEMLSGRRAFPGGDTTEVLAGVIKSDVAWNLLPANTPPRLRTLLRRCLHKDPKQRLRDVGDARIEIEDVLTAPDVEPLVTTAMPRGRNERLAWGIAAMAIVTAVAVGARTYFDAAPADTHVYRSSILPPRDKNIGTAIPPARFTLSPDGRRLAFVAGTAGGQTELWVQSLDGLSAQPLAGTNGALAPFWSPDSRFIGFYAGGKLKTIDAAGGPPLTLADTTGSAGGTWNRDNVILFATTGGANPIRRVLASGGTVSPATKLDTGNGETQHWAPFFLPDGRHFLYVVAGTKAGGSNDLNGIYVTALDSNERKLLVPGGSNAKYAQGYLLFLREQALMAQPFDVERLELTGNPAPIADQVATGGVSGRLGAFTVSDQGVLAYQTGSATDVSQLTWFDRMGKQIGVLGDQADYGDLELSPDGRRAAMSISERGNRDIWLYDIARGLRTRFTFDQAEENEPIWSPDGSQIIFASNRKGYDLYQKASSGVGSEDVLQADNMVLEWPLSWSGDGRFVLYARGGQGVWVLPLVGDRKPFPFLQTPFNETLAVFSPDGRHVAYVSNESGRNEVYVAPFPERGGKWQVSTAGGNWPRWRRDGAEIFYLAPDNRLMAAAVNGRGPGFEVGTVRPLFQTRVLVNRRYMYDVSADAQRFLVNTLVEQAALQPITLVVNWTAGLKK